MSREIMLYRKYVHLDLDFYQTLKEVAAADS